MRSLLLTLLCAIAAVSVLAAAGCGDGVPTSGAGRATCADYATQEQAQRAADTADPDGDGRYCESLPSASAGPGGAKGAPDATGDGASAQTGAPACQRTARVVDVGISATRYPAVVQHIDAAVADGWPRVLRIRRDGAEQRRSRLLQGMPTRAGYDRDEWPMAMARSDWRAHVAYVPSGQNRGAGSSIALKLRRWCDGVRFRVVAY